MKLHIGCGNKNLLGYKHFDARKVDAHIDFVGDCSDLSMFEDNSLEEIYACHLLEHIERYRVDAVLKEWYRVIKRGGVLRLAVPNFEAIVSYYNETHDLAKVFGLLYGGQDYEFNFHYGTFDFDYLRKKLLATGFKKIERYDWREFLPPDYDDFSRAYLPHMDFEHGKLMSLNMTAEK